MFILTCCFTAGNPFLDFYTSVKGGDTTIREFEYVDDTFCIIILYLCRKTFLRVKPMQFNLELGVVVSLLPLVDSLDHKQVHYKLFLFCVEIFELFCTNFVHLFKICTVSSIVY